MAEIDYGRNAWEEAARIINQGRSVEIRYNDAAWLGTYFSLRLEEISVQAAKESAFGRVFLKFGELLLRGYDRELSHDLNMYKKGFVVMTEEELEMVGKDLTNMMELAYDLPLVKQAYLAYRRLRKRFEEVGEGAVG